MATTTDTLIAEREVQSGGTGAPPQAPPRSPRRRPRYAWAAVVAACAAVGVTVGIIVADDSDTPEASNRSALAHQADQYTKQLESQAAKAERQAFVDGLTTVYGPGSDQLTDPATSPAFPSVPAIERDIELQPQPASPVFPSLPAIERQLELEGKTQGPLRASPSFPSVAAIERELELANASNADALKHHVEQYLEWLESQAESASQGDDFVPGSRHMPNR